MVWSRKYLAESVENVVEEEQNLSFRNLGYVVHALTGVVTDSSVLIRKAGKNWWYDSLQIASNIILPSDQPTVLTMA